MDNFGKSFKIFQETDLLFFKVEIYYLYIMAQEEVDYPLLAPEIQEARQRLDPKLDVIVGFYQRRGDKDFRSAGVQTDADRARGILVEDRLIAEPPKETTYSEIGRRAGYKGKAGSMVAQLERMLAAQIRHELKLKP